MYKRAPLSATLTLSYIEEGNGYPVLFIPGWTYTTNVFERNIPAFAREFHVIAYDPRSHGNSSITRDGNNYDQHGYDLHNFLKYMQITDCIIIGWSLGVTTAYSYFEKYGTKKVKAFISVDESPRIKKVSADDWGEGTEPELQQLSKQLEENGHLQFFEDYLYTSYICNPEEEFVEKMLADSRKTPSDIAIELINDTINLDYRDVAASIDSEIPVFQIVREDWSRAANSWITRNQPNAKIKQMPAHLSFHEYADVFNLDAIGFCTECYLQ